MDNDEHEIRSTSADELVDGFEANREATFPPRRKRLLKAIEDVRKAIGGADLYHMEFDDADVLFVKPNTHQFNEATGKSAENKKRAPDALNMLATQIVKYPDAETFRAMREEFPGVGM